MKCTRKESQLDKITVGNIQIDQVRSLSYIGTIVNGNNTLEEEIRERIVKGYKAFYANRALFKSKLVSRKSKLKLYWSVIRPVVVYGCETWALKESIIQKLSVFERKVLRHFFFGSTKEDNGNWRIKTNIELDEIIKHQNIINYVKAQRLSWFGHINRMSETSIVNKIHKWKETIHRKTSTKTQVPMGRRCQERPEEDETQKMDRTSPRSPQKERNCLEDQDSTRVVVPTRRRRRRRSILK